MFSPYRIRNIEIKPGLVLAPMSGVTCSPFRRLIKESNPGAVGLVISEFISVEGMTRQGQRSLGMMRFREEERPYGIQIFGYDISRMRDAARMCEDAGVDLVDINCGCPAPKVVRNGGGCELMRQPEHLQRMVREVRGGIKIPLTLKMRSGWDDSSRNAGEIAKIVVGEGVEALTIHGRTRAQLYRGEADWSFAQQVAEEFTVPVCGSGDVVDRASADARLSPGIAGLYIGRAVLADPFVFSRIISGATTKLSEEPERALAVMERFAELLIEDFPPQVCTGRLKQLASQVGAGFIWKKELLRAEGFEEQQRILKAARTRLMHEGPQSLKATAASVALSEPAPERSSC